MNIRTQNRGDGIPEPSVKRQRYDDLSVDMNWEVPTATDTTATPARMYTVKYHQLEFGRRCSKYGD